MEQREKKFFGLVSIRNYVCNNCGALFTKKGDRYKLAKARDVSNKVWQEYGNQTLTLREWENIANGGMSDEKQRRVDMERWMNELKNGRVSVKFIGITSPILLKKGEDLKATIPHVSLKEPRSVRVSSGGYGGPSFRIAKGFYFRVGSFGSRSVSHEEIKIIDEGTLILTNKRIVFIGQKRTLNIKLDKIISIEPYSDGIALRREGKEKTQYFIWHKNNINIDGRRYKESFSGLIFKYLIEGIKNSGQ